MDMTPSENQTALEMLLGASSSGGLVVGSSAGGVFGGRQQGDGGQRLRHGGGGGGGRGNYGRGVSAARVEDTALTAEVPEWLNYVELGVTGCSLVFVLVTSSVVLAVIACTPSLHRIPGMVMALLSVIDILLALFDSGNIVIRLADQLFALQLNYYRIFCQVSLSQFLIFRHSETSPFFGFVRFCVSKWRNFSPSIFFSYFATDVKTLKQRVPLLHFSTL